MTSKAKAITVPGSEIYRDVLLDKVDAARLAGCLEQVGVKVKTKDGIKGLVDVYADWLKAQKESGSQLLRCMPEEGGCGIYSLDSVSECPGCGMGDEPTEAATVEGPEPGNTSALVEKAEQQLSRVEQLDAAVARIRARMGDACKAYWELGRELLKVHEQKLYLARMADGKPVYKDWRKFCEVELNMHSNHAYNMIAVVQACTEQDVKQIGFTKLKLVAKLEGADKERLLEMARSNASVRQIANELHVIRNPSSRPVGGAAGSLANRRPQVGAATSQSDIKGGLTVTFRQATTELRMDKDKQTGFFVCREELINGIVCSYVFDPKKGVLKITRKRSE